MKTICKDGKHLYGILTKEQVIKEGKPISGMQWWKCEKCGNMVQSM